MKRPAGSRLAAIRTAAPPGKARGKSWGLSETEGREIVARFRRGEVSAKTIATALGVTPQAVYSLVGSWALRYARIDEA